jgi:Xaa-Pro dipeptidase
MTVVEILPDDAALRRARRARVLAAMEEADVDFLIVGREGNARYVSGAPRLWTAGSRAFGPGCVFVRASGEVHLLSTWDEGIPEEIPHGNLYGITFNALNFVTVLSKIPGAAEAKRVATDSMSGSSANVLPKAFPSAEFVDGEPMLRQIRRVKSAEEIEAIRASVRVAERALAAATEGLVPGVTERQLTAIFMEAMAAEGVTTPSGQDVAWITSRREPWGRTNRDTPVQPGDLVAFEAGVVLGGYSGEVGRTHAVREGGHVDSELARRTSALWELLLDACTVGAPLAGLLDAYDAAGEPQPPMPVARGLGLGFDLPLVTRSLPLTARDQHVEAGMVLALTGYVWKEGVGALYVQEPIVITEAGPESLATSPLRSPREQGA